MSGNSDYHNIVPNRYDIKIYLDNTRLKDAGLRAPRSITVCSSSSSSWLAKIVTKKYIYIYTLYISYNSNKNCARPRLPHRGRSQWLVGKRPDWPPPSTPLQPPRGLFCPPAAATVSTRFYNMTCTKYAYYRVPTYVPIYVTRVSGRFHTEMSLFFFLVFKTAVSRRRRCIMCREQTTFWTPKTRKRPHCEIVYYVIISIWSTVV